MRFWKNANRHGFRENARRLSLTQIALLISQATESGIFSVCISLFTNFILYFSLIYCKIVAYQVSYLSSCIPLKIVAKESINQIIIYIEERYMKKLAFVVVLLSVTLSGCCHTFAKPSPYAVPVNSSYQ